VQYVNGIRKIKAQMMIKVDNSIKKGKLIKSQSKYGISWVLEALKVKLSIRAKFSQKRSIICNAEGEGASRATSSA